MWGSSLLCLLNVGGWVYVFGGMEGGVSFCILLVCCGSCIGGCVFCVVLGAVLCFVLCVL